MQLPFGEKWWEQYRKPTQVLGPAYYKTEHEKFLRHFIYV